MMDTTVIGCAGSTDPRHTRCYVPRINAKGERVKGRRAAGQGIYTAVRTAMWNANVENGFVRCAECNVPCTYGDMEVAHMKADANGGSFCYDNLVLTCRSCNADRGNADMTATSVRLDWDWHYERYSEAAGKSLHRILSV